MQGRKLNPNTSRSSTTEADIPVTGMDSAKNILIVADGRRFHEINSNIWMVPGSDAAYLGTSKHGGGIVLRLLFVKTDGEWINATTGRKAPFDKSVFEIV